VSVTSAPGEGTTFSVRLPIHGDGDDDAPTPEDDRATGPSSRAPGGEDAGAPPASETAATGAAVPASAAGTPR
jgi:hypothetical protein